MKKLVFAVVGLMIIITVQAQKNVSFGPVAGFGHAWMSGGGDNQYKPSGNFGVQLYYSATEHIGFGADFRYSIEGGEKSFGSTETTTRLNYIRIPVQVIYFFNDYGDRVRPKISIGPSFGFLAGGKQTTGAIETGVKHDYKTLDMGILGNVGLHARLISETWLTLDLNYYHGLADITETAASTYKNRNFGINVGLAFGIARKR